MTKRSASQGLPAANRTISGRVSCLPSPALYIGPQAKSHGDKPRSSHSPASPILTPKPPLGHPAAPPPPRCCWVGERWENGFSMSFPNGAAGGAGGRPGGCAGKHPRVGHPLGTRRPPLWVTPRRGLGCGAPAGRGGSSNAGTAAQQRHSRRGGRKRARGDARTRAQRCGPARAGGAGAAAPPRCRCRWRRRRGAARRGAAGTHPAVAAERGPAVAVRCGAAVPGPGGGGGGAERGGAAPHRGGHCRLCARRPLLRVRPRTALRGAGRAGWGGTARSGSGWNGVGGREGAGCGRVSVLTATRSVRTGNAPRVRALRVRGP